MRHRAPARSTAAAAADAVDLPARARPGAAAAPPTGTTAAAASKAGTGAAEAALQASHKRIHRTRLAKQTIIQEGVSCPHSRQHTSWAQKRHKPTASDHQLIAINAAGSCSCKARQGHSGRRAPGSTRTAVLLPLALLLYSTCERATRVRLTRCQRHGTLSILLI